MITLKDCVDTCYENKEFVKEFNRLFGTNIRNYSKKVSKNKRREDLKEFIKNVDILIYQPLKGAKWLKLQ